MLTERGLFEIPVSLHALSVWHLPANTRVHNCLRRAGIDVLGQLHGLEVERILGLPNFGKNAMSVLLEALEKLAANVDTDASFELGGELAYDPLSDQQGKLRELVLSVPESLHAVPLPLAAFSARAQNCLTRAGIRTLGQLDGISGDWLLGLPGFGRTAFQSVLDRLSQLSQEGMPLPTETPEAPVQETQILSSPSALALLACVIQARTPRSWSDRMNVVLRHRLLAEETYQAIGKRFQVTGARIHHLMSMFLTSHHTPPALERFEEVCLAAAQGAVTELGELQEEVSRTLGWPLSASDEEREAFRILCVLVPGLAHLLEPDVEEGKKSPRLKAVEMIRQVLADHADRALHFTQIASLVTERFGRLVSERRLYVALLEQTPELFARTSLGYYTLQEYAANLSAAQSGRRHLPDWFFVPWENGVRLRLPSQSMRDRQAAFAWRITDPEGNTEIRSARQVAGETLPSEFHASAPGEWEVAFCADGEPLWREIVALPPEPLSFSASSGAMTRDPSGETYVLLPPGWSLSGGRDPEPRPSVGEWDVVAVKAVPEVPLRFASPEGRAWDGRSEWLFLGRRGLFESEDLDFEDGVPVYLDWPDLHLKADWQGVVEVEGPAGNVEFDSGDVSGFSRVSQRDGLYTLTLTAAGKPSRGYRFRLLRGLHLRRAAAKKYAWMLELPSNYQVIAEEDISVRPIGRAYELEVSRGRLRGCLTLRANGGADAVGVTFSPPQVAWRLEQKEGTAWTRERLDLSREDLRTGALWLDLRGVGADSVLTFEEFDGTVLGLLPLKAGVRKSYHLSELSRGGLDARSAYIKLYVGGEVATVARLRQGWHPQDLHVEPRELTPEGLRVMVQWSDESPLLNRSLIFNSLSRPWEPAITMAVPDGAFELAGILPPLGGYYEVCAQSSEVDELDFFGEGAVFIPGAQDIVYVFGDEEAEPPEGWAGRTADILERYFVQRERQLESSDLLAELRPPDDVSGAAILLDGCRRIQAWVPRDQNYAGMVQGLLDRTRWELKSPYLRGLERIPEELVHWLAIPQLATEALEEISPLLGQPAQLLLNGEDAFWNRDLWLAAWRGSLFPVAANGGIEVRIPVHLEDPLSVMSRQLIEHWRRDPISRYQMFTWVRDQRMLDYLQKRLADYDLQDVYLFLDAGDGELLRRFLFMLHAVACLCRHIARFQLSVDSRLSRHTQQVDRIAGPLLWMALSYWEVNGD